jgi:hypothetical protein
MNYPVVLESALILPNEVVLEGDLGFVGLVSYFAALETIGNL